MKLSAEDQADLQKILTDFEKFRKRKYRSFQWFKRLTIPLKIAYYVTVPVVVVSAIIPFLFAFTWPVIAIGASAFVFQLILYQWVFREPDEKFYRKFKEEIMPLAFEKINPNFQYDYRKKFSLERIKGMALFKDTVSEYHGEDYVKGKVLDVEIEFCEATLKTRKYSAGSVAKGAALSVLSMVADGDGDASISKEKVFFQGLLMEVDFHKDFSGQVFALPKRYIDAGIFKRKQFSGSEAVETGNPDFDQRHSVFASDEVLLHYVLTPALLQKITNLKERLNAEMFLSLMDGKLNMGIHWGRDLFECDFAKGIPSVDEFMVLAEDIQLFEDIVTSLSQERRIWGDKAIA